MKTKHILLIVVSTVIITSAFFILLYGPDKKPAQKQLSENNEIVRIENNPTVVHQNNTATQAQQTKNNEYMRMALANMQANSPHKTKFMKEIQQAGKLLEQRRLETLSEFEKWKSEVDEELYQEIAEDYKQAVEDVQDGDCERANSTFDRIDDAAPGNPSISSGKLSIMQCYYENHEIDKAYEASKELIGKYPTQSTLNGTSIKVSALMQQLQICSDKSNNGCIKETMKELSNHSDDYVNQYKSVQDFLTETEAKLKEVTAG